jgi:perosamine synthetase
MLVTDDDQVIERCAVLRDHGRVPGDTLFRNVEVGYKYRMSALQAALGLAQLERIDELVQKKRTIFDWYRRELVGTPGLTLNHEAPETRNSYWMVTAIVDPSYGLRKEDILAGLRSRGIDCRPFFYPLSSLRAYRELPGISEAMWRSPTAYKLSATGVNLPSALELTQEDVATACAALRTTLRLA